MSTEQGVDIKEIVDKLYLELFSLMEQQVQCKLEIEKHYFEGHSDLSKTRQQPCYKSLGIINVPTGLMALAKTDEVPSDSSLDGRQLQLIKCEMGREEGLVDPINWFSSLPPRNLRSASKHFKSCVELVVEAANIQRNLLWITKCLKSLKFKD